MSVGQCHSLVYRTCSYFIDYPNNTSFFSGTGSYVGIHVFIVMSLQTSSAAFFFDSFRNYRPYICRMTPNLGPCDISSWLQSGHALLVGIPQKWDCALLSVLHAEACSVKPRHSNTVHVGVLLYFISICGEVFQTMPASCFSH